MVAPVMFGSWGPGVIRQGGEVAVGAGSGQGEDEALATRMAERVSKWRI